jgi:predicted MFS family arabinose efflux permease
MPPTTTDRPSWGLIARVCLIAIGIGYNFALIGPIARTLSDQFGVSLGMIGLLTTGVLITHALSQLPAAVPAQKYGPLKLVRYAFVLVAIANLLGAISPVFWLLAVTRMIVGIGTGPVFVGGLDGSRRLGGAFLAGVFGGAATFGLGLALVMGAAFDSFGWSWHLTFLVAAAFALAAAAFGPKDSDEPRPQTGNVVDHLGAVLRSGPLWRLALIHSATFGVSLVVGAWIVIYFREGAITGFLAGAIGFSLLAMTAIFRPIGGALFARGVSWRVIGPAAVLTCGLGLGVLSIGLPSWLAALVSLVIGVSFALPFSAIFVLTVKAEPRYPAAGIAFVNMTGGVFALIITPIAGILLDHGVGWIAFAGMGVIAVIAAWVARDPVPD